MLSHYHFLTFSSRFFRAITFFFVKLKVVGYRSSLFVPLITIIDIFVVFLHAQVSRNYSRLTVYIFIVVRWCDTFISESTSLQPPLSVLNRLKIQFFDIYKSEKKCKIKSSMEIVCRFCGQLNGLIDSLMLGFLFPIIKHYTSSVYTRVKFNARTRDEKRNEKYYEWKCDGEWFHARKSPNWISFKLHTRRSPLVLIKFIKSRHQRREKRDKKKALWVKVSDNWSINWLSKITSFTFSPGKDSSNFGRDNWRLQTDCGFGGLWDVIDRQTVENRFKFWSRAIKSCWNWWTRRWR